MSIALYRKYRPEDFENLVGQEVVQTTLKNAILSNKLAHAYILAGPRGTGKTSTARLIAKALNCTNLKDGYSPCNECEFCKDIARGSLLDVVEIDAASHNGVDDVRELVDKINFSPTRSKYKFYIVDEAHMMSKGAFNALLKTLEEPPDYVYFILATTEIHKVPETILSRCQRFDFQRIGLKELQGRLEFIADSEGFEYESDAIEMIARFVNGGLRDALVALEKLAVAGKITTDLVRSNLGISDFRECRNMLELLMQKNAQEALKFVSELYEKGVDLRQFLKDFIALTREQLLEETAKSSPLVGEILRLIDLALEARITFEKTDIPQLVWELLIVKFAFSGSVMPKLVTQNSVVKTEETTTQQVVKKVTISDIGKPLSGDLKEKKVSEVVMVEEKKVEKEEVKMDANVVIQNTAGLSSGEVQRGINDIIDSFQSPSLRMSFKTLQVVSTTGGVLTLGVNSSFHLERVKGGIKDLELGLRNLKGWEFQIELKLVETPVVIEPEMPREFAGIKPPEPPKVEEPPKVNPDIDLALDMFGGEIID